MSGENAPKSSLAQEDTTDAAPVEPSKISKEVIESGSDWKEFVETAGKLTAAFGALCYFVGLIVVNFYLGKYGYFSLSLVESRYVAAGVLAFIPLSFSWFFLNTSQARFKARNEAFEVLATIENLKGAAQVDDSLNQLERQFRDLLESTKPEFDELEKIKKWTGAVGVAAASFFGGPKVYKWFNAIIFSLLAYLSPIVIFSPLENQFDHWSISLLMVFAVGCAVVVGLPEVSHELEVEGLREISNVFRRIKNPAFTFVMFFVYVLTFARILYPAIPPHLGGGHPQEVQLVVSPAEQQNFLASGVPFPEGSTQSETVRILLATSDSLILLVTIPLTNTSSLETTRVIEVKRDGVQVVVYNPGRTLLTDTTR